MTAPGPRGRGSSVAERGVTSAIGGDAGDRDTGGRDTDGRDTGGRDTGGAPDAQPRSWRARRRAQAAVVAGLVVLVLFAVWLVAFSPAFGVRTVQVRGIHTLSAHQVQSAAAIPHGTPLVRVDAARATTRVERLPDVASAQVTTSFPSTVTITVVERVAVGYVRSGGRAILVDRTGAAYHSLPSAPAHLPVLVVPTVASARSARAAVAQVAAALPAALRAQVRSIDALDPSAITLVLTGQRIARWGSVAQSAEKGRILPVLLTHAKHDSQYDVTDPARPFSR